MSAFGFAWFSKRQRH